MRTLALTCAILAAPWIAQAQKTITVSGSGRVQLPPDRVSFSLGVTTQRASVAEAVRENSEKTRRVVAALKTHGVTDPEIQTSSFSIDQPWEAGRRIADQYLVRNSVTVTRKDPGAMSELLQAAVDAGANQAYAPRFFLADSSTARDRALELAYRDARARAEKLAGVAGKALGDPIMITTERNLVPQVGGNLQVTADAPPIETGLTTTVATVIVTFELK